jgi:hypothetical protein
MDDKYHALDHLKSYQLIYNTINSLTIRRYVILFIKNARKMVFLILLAFLKT